MTLPLRPDAFTTVTAAYVSHFTLLVITHTTISGVTFTAFTFVVVVIFDLYVDLDTFVCVDPVPTFTAFPPTFTYVFLHYAPPVRCYCSPRPLFPDLFVVVCDLRVAFVCYRSGP